MSSSKIYTLTFLIMIVVIGLSSVCIAEELGTAFTYQGRLLNDNIAADGLYDFQFILYDDPNILYGYQIGNAIDVNDLDVVEGYFTAVLDFGDDPDIFNEDARWLQIGVRAGQSEDTDEYTILEPLQQIMPTPYAYHSSSASDTKPYDPPTKAMGDPGEWDGDGSNIYYTDGKVGIGTTSPREYLEVAKSTGARFIISDNQGDNRRVILMKSPTSTADYGSILSYKYGANAGSRNLILNKYGGNVGIGTTSPRECLEVARSTGARFIISDNQGDNRRVILMKSPTSTADYGSILSYKYGANSGSRNLILNKYGGNVGIGTTSPTAKLEVAGTTKTQILEITGGSDLAEPFEIGGAESVQPGMVVCIDADNPGQLKLSGKAYDRTVAGIVSGANGINAGLTMRQEGTIADGSMPVALTGRVYCWCDADSGPINPGDLLTTSNTPGHAMKVTDYSKSAGAIIGKAMSKLENGKGLVLVLVSLQ